MSSLDLWTPNRVAGYMLLLSFCIAMGVSFYMRVKDKGGPIIFGQPPHEWLRLVHEHPRAWRWGTISFVGAILVATLGLDLFAGRLRATGDPGFSGIGLLAFAIGAVLWLILLSARLTVDIWAGNELASRAVIPDAYFAISRWNGAMFILFTILAFGGMMAFGGAILATNLLPHWLGWASIIYSAAGLAILAVTHDALPIMHHLMPLVFGVALLL